jgi:diaminopimelate epimerase
VTGRNRATQVVHRRVLTKHHGLGNDFLVLLDLDGTQPVDEAMARALCDRHRGIGADGIIRVTAGRDGSDVTMELRNADGSRAEMSGNGIRCLAQAVVDADIVKRPELRVSTDAGLKCVRIGRETAPGLREATVDMGRAVQSAAVTVELDAENITCIDMGNPHLVVLVHDPGKAEFDAYADDGNVEAISAGPETNALTMRVWERGVGETEACGTGACAAAFAAHGWGLVGTKVIVHQPGGDAVVELRDDTILLTGPAQFIATIEVEVRP